VQVCAHTRRLEETPKGEKSLDKVRDSMSFRNRLLQRPRFAQLDSKIGPFEALFNSGIP